MTDQLPPDGDPLAALAVLDPADLAVRPLAEISGRAAQVRRARRARTAVLGTAASVTLVAGLSFVLPTGATTATPSTTTSQAASATATPVDCNLDVVTFTVTRRPELLHLLDGPGAPRLSSAEGVDLPGAPCSGGVTGPAAVRARFSADGGTVTAGLVVSGPLAEAPWPTDRNAPPTPGETSTEEPTPSGSPDPRGIIDEQVHVAGTTGHLYRWPTDSRTLVTVGTAGVEWQDADGRWWAVQSAGLSKAALLAVADGLRVAGGGLDTASVPGPAAGWTVLPVEDTGRPGHRFDSSYEVGDEMGALSLSVSDVPQFGADLVGLVSPGAVRVADVGGAQAFLRPIGIDGDSPSLQWSKDGLWFVLYAGPQVTFDDLVRLARSVAPVGVDDPRITGMVAVAPPASDATTGPAAVPAPGATATPGEPATATPTPSGGFVTTTPPGDPAPPTVTGTVTVGPTG